MKPSPLAVSVLLSILSVSLVHSDANFLDRIVRAKMSFFEDKLGLFGGRRQKKSLDSSMRPPAKYWTSTFFLPEQQQVMRPPAGDTNQNVYRPPSQVQSVYRPPSRDPQSPAYRPPAVSTSQTPPVFSPGYVSPIDDGYGAPQYDPVDDGYGAPEYDPVNDGYGAPLAPVINENQCLCDHNHDQYRPPPPDDQYHDLIDDNQYQPVEVTTPEQCLHVVSSRQFLLESPRHSRSRDCDYVIIPDHGVCSLTLSFSWFFIKHSYNCSDEYLEIMGTKMCGELTGKQVSLWMPLGDAWELKYHSSSTFHGDYFGFKIKGTQEPCPTSSTPSTTTSSDDVVIVDNCSLTDTCDEDGEGRTVALETTTAMTDDDEVNIPTPSKRVAG